MGATLQIIREAAGLGFRPSPSEPIWRWCEQHIFVDKTSPMPGRWRLDNSPWVKEVMDCFQDESVNDISVMCAAQSSKTQTMINLLAWAISCAPGPAMWVMAAQDEAKTFGKTRLMPTLENCAPVAERFPAGRWDKTTLEINFASMPLIINGANSQSKLQSKPIRYLFLDEVRNYPPGALEMVLKRTRAFWNAKRLIISTPDLASPDAVEDAFLAGDQRRFHVSCPICASGQPLVWKQMKWETNDVTCPGGTWNFDRVMETVRYECVKCGHAIKDTMENRKALARSGVWVKNNMNAPSNKVSFTWNAILPPWVRWHDLVSEFIRARIAYKMGAVEPLKTFINESLGEPWSAEYFYDENPPATYEVNSEWKDEKERFLTVDVQAEGVRWAVVRAWSKTGESRRLFFGKLIGWEPVNILQEQFKVNANHVLIDSGYDTREVYRYCATNGWVALKGEDDQYFTHNVKRGDKHQYVRRSYAPLTKADPEMGTNRQGQRFANLIRWSNPMIKYRLKRLREGKGSPWLVPNDGDEIEYRKQLSAEFPKLKINKTTGQREWIWVCPSGNNHAFDCEAMQVLAATLCGILPDLIEPEQRLNDAQEKSPQPQTA